MTTKDYQRKRPLAIFLHYFKNHKKLFFLDICCAVLISCVDLAFPLVTRTALYDLLPESRYQTFFLAMGIMAGAYVLRGFLQFIVAYYGHTFGIHVEADIRADLFKHLQELGFDFYDKNRTGHLMSRLTSDLFDLTELAHHGPEDLLTAAMTIIGALVVMFTIQWRLAVVMLVIIPVFLAAIMTQRRSMSKVSKQVKAKVGVINAEVETSLTGIRTAKAFGNEATEYARFTKANNQYRGSKREFHKAMGRFSSLMELFVSSLNVIVVAVGGYWIMRGQLDYVDLLTFSLYISTFVTPLRKIAGFAEMFSSGFAGLNRFVDIMRTEPSQQDAPDAQNLEHVKGAIEVENVSFAYDGDLAVLHNVNLKVRPGETIAIVGPSGGGNSTLCQLIP